MTSHDTLSQLGWKPFFQLQLSLSDFDNLTPARVLGVERSLLKVMTTDLTITLPLTPSMPAMAVGDWILIDEHNQYVRQLERQSLFARKAAGTKVQTQLIAANIDTVFIVSSLNDDLNLSRIERYLALAHEAKVEPVIVLTKVDLCEQADDLIEQVQALDNMLPVFAVNALDATRLQPLNDWLGTSNTVAFLGSSGVGKSTLVNTLLGDESQKTSGIREDDVKGRHTTTSRSLHLLPSGALLLDTPGMRELQLVDCEQGVTETFADIKALASQCKFSDCTHQTEPHCAVQQAIEQGELDERRFRNYQKLLKEQAFNSATLAEKRAQDKRFGKMVKSAMKSKHNRP